jgi:hypothetical protein
MPSPQFASTLASSGMALAHWHGYLHHARLPDGYVVHGEENPPVSCSTFQAAIFALGGKMDAFVRAASGGREFAGDLHTEPHHGINVTGPTLLWLARWALDNLDALRESSGGDGVAGRERPWRKEDGRKNVCDDSHSSLCVNRMSESITEV